MVKNHPDQLHQKVPHGWHSAGMIPNLLGWWPALAQEPEVLLMPVTAPESNWNVVGTVKHLSRTFVVTSPGQKDNRACAHPKSSH